MRYYNELTESELNKIRFDVIKTNKKVSYLNIEAAFDIETTSTTLGEEKVAFMYVWQFGIGFGNTIYYGRTWAEFAELCDLLQQTYDLGFDRRLVVYVHNLGYEFQFMRKYFKWVDTFSLDERKPVKVTCTQGIEFRDSYALSGFSLANTAKNLSKHKLKKALGDLDYSLIRTHLTPLTDEELNYCELDIAIVLAYINEQIEQCGNIAKIPMTNTGRVRKYVRNGCYYTNKSHGKTSKGKYIRYRKVMEDLTLTDDDYRQLKQAFMGGFTHANAIHSGVLLENVSSVDFTSSYPSVMLSERFPMSRFRPIKVENDAHFKQLCADYAVLFNIKFENIRPKIRQENYISESKCIDLKNPVINNGRIVEADSLSMVLTEIDLGIINQCYEYDSYMLSNVKYAHKDYLPKAIIESVLQLYQDKTELKDVQGSEAEYMLAKGMLNSIYGMCVTDPVKEVATYNNKTFWGKEPTSVTDCITAYNESKNRFLFYGWGVWITAYARKNLWTGILAVGDDYVYSDTDSLKLLNYDDHIGYIDWFNNQIVAKMTAMCKAMKLSTDLLNPKTKDGVVKMMGVWDFEGTYPLFKTLGAKRYLLESRGKLQLTVAGLSKQNGINYMLEKNGGNHRKVFDDFNDDLYIPSANTGKMTHTYIDTLNEFEIVDYMGQLAFVSTESGIHLEPCDFTLSISNAYMTFIKNLRLGYVFKGVKHI